jgi:hypothetical protein
LRTLSYLPGQVATHPAFPAPHVRTNGFLIERRTLLSLRTGKLSSKIHTHRFEGGRRSMTAQLAARGLRALVVGRDGSVLDPDRWPDGEIFWQGGQRNLLIADNQSQQYDRATPAGREVLARLAWGEQARPA